MYYVYKITNNINGKFYIGKRKHNFPYKDKYMGSGKLILLAIKKYGKDNFTKEILGIFDSDKDSSEFEKSLVTKEMVESENCYNMHEGGHGGFMHINNLPPNERVNVISYKEKVQSGKISVGGDKSEYFTEESYKKMKRGSMKGIETLKNKSEEEKEITKNKISLASTGSKNSQFGKKSYINVSTGEKKKFKENQIPVGWILTESFLEDKMKNSKRWYNDGYKNYYIIIPNLLIEELNLKKGRIRRK